MSNSVLLFDQMEDFLDWIQARARSLAMQVEERSLQEISPWVLQEGKILNPLVSFFWVGGLSVVNSLIGRWSQPMIFGQTDGHVALIIDSDGNVLVQATAEPGNLGIEIDGVNTRVLVGPPIQFSQGKLELHEKALRGECRPGGDPYQRVPFVGLVQATIGEEGVHSRQTVRAVEDGGRFFEKENKYHLVTVDGWQPVADQVAQTSHPECFVWVTRELFSQIMHEPRLPNGHLRSVASLLL